MANECSRVYDLIQEVSDKDLRNKLADAFCDFECGEAYPHMLSHCEDYEGNAEVDDYDDAITRMITLINKLPESVRHKIRQSI